MKVYMNDDETHVNPQPHNDILWGLKAHCVISSWDKVTLIKSWANLIIITIFLKPDNFEWKKLVYSAVNDNYICLSLR